MAKSLAALQSQIEKLQARANAIKAKDAVGVIARIKTAIAFYDLSPADLFDESPVQARKIAPKATEARKSKAPAKTSPRPAKYGDGQGNTWGGHGKRPKWFVEALAAGRTADDMLIAKP